MTFPKIVCHPTRSTKCRLISSVERMEFEDVNSSYLWQCVRFGDDEGKIFNKTKKSSQKFKLTEFQKLLLNSDTMLKNQFLSRSEIKEETGNWKIAADLQNKIISEGGEASVFIENFDGFETAVRVQIFDPFLFTDDFGLDSLSWKMHFEKGWVFVSFLYSVIKIMEKRELEKWETWLWICFGKKCRSTRTL